MEADHLGISHPSKEPEGYDCEIYRCQKLLDRLRWRLLVRDYSTVCPKFRQSCKGSSLYFLTISPARLQLHDGERIDRTRERRRCLTCSIVSSNMPILVRSTHPHASRGRKSPGVLSYIHSASLSFFPYNFQRRAHTSFFNKACCWFMPANSVGRSETCILGVRCTNAFR